MLLDGRQFAPPWQYSISLLTRKSACSISKSTLADLDGECAITPLSCVEIIKLFRSLSPTGRYMKLCHSLHLFSIMVKYHFLPQSATGDVFEGACQTHPFIQGLALVSPQSVYQIVNGYTYILLPSLCHNELSRSRLAISCHSSLRSESPAGCRDSSLRSE